MLEVHQTGKYLQILSKIIIYVIFVIFITKDVNSQCYWYIGTRNNDYSLYLLDWICSIDNIFQTDSSAHEYIVDVIRLLFTKRHSYCLSCNTIVNAICKQSIDITYIYTF